MAGQQQQIIDTIFNMKRRLLRKDDSSDSDETDSPYRSRLHSLKRKAQYARSGKPESPLDPPPYKKRIEHAGYHRYILHRNPPRFDPDGDIVEPSDEYEDEDDLSDVEENPYADIKLEELLAPLASAAELPTHASYSTAYTSKHLTNLTSEAGAISRKEQVSLWQSKALFTKLMGDLSYVPTDLTDLDSGDCLQEALTDGVNGSKPQPVHGDRRLSALPDVADRVETQHTSSAQDTIMKEADAHAHAHADQTDGVVAPRSEVHGDAAPAPESNENGSSTRNGLHEADLPELPHENGHGPQSPPADDVSDTASQQTAHRMTTRARAHAASTPSPPSSPSSANNPVHPLFNFPIDSLPDRDFGLPAAEAEDTRLLLLAFVQKQEEISRAATDLYTGMLQGERMRQDVFKWSKAEAHVGEMSDGEDWYDREEWNLDQDLLKGRDEEEDDTQVQGKKSTRQRRKPDKDDR